MNTQTTTIETKTIGIEVMNLSSTVDQKPFSNQRTTAHQDYNTAPTVKFSNTNINTTPTEKYSANIISNNKRKCDFRSPNNTELNFNINTATNVIDTNENSYSGNSNNSTPKKRRLLIGKNVNKVPELSISTIERHLETLISDSNNCITQLEVNGEPSKINDNSILIVENENINNDDENMVGKIFS